MTIYSRMGPARIILGFGLALACASISSTFDPSIAAAKPNSSPIDITPAAKTAGQQLKCVLLNTECMRWVIPLLGNPHQDTTLRNKYIAAFGDACYTTESASFVCVFKKPADACAAELKVATIYGAAPYEDHGCTIVSNDPESSAYNDYRLQIGADSALNVYIPYELAPRQTPLVDAGQGPVEVSGPYRAVPAPLTEGPGHDFQCAVVDNNGTQVTQVERILDVNRKAHAGKVHSDLSGFKFPCKVNGTPTTCTEPVELDVPGFPGTKPQVHHVVPRRDKRGCPWGSNSNKNAAVISQALNAFLSNDQPPALEVSMLNNSPSYTP